MLLLHARVVKQSPSVSPPKVLQPAKVLLPFGAQNEVQVVAVNPAVKAKSVPKIKFTYTVYGIGKRLPRFEGPPEIKDYKTPKHTNKFFKFMKGYRDEVRHLLASKKDDQAEAFLRRKWTIAPEINGKRYVVTPVACSCCLLPLHAPVACSVACFLCRSDVFTQQEAHDLCNNEFLRDVIVVYFMRYFARTNANLHVVGFDHLLRYGDFDATGEFKPTPQRSSKRNLRSDIRWENAIIPTGHLEKGGVVVAPINYPRFACSPCMLPLVACSCCMLPLHAPFDACSHIIPRKQHWQFAVLRLEENFTQPVVEVRDNIWTVPDPRAKTAALYFANVCTLILRRRQPDMPTLTLYRTRCSSYHSINACGLCVIAQTMLFAANKEKTHQVTRSLTDKLRKWIVTYLVRYSRDTITIPVRDEKS